MSDQPDRPGGSSPDAAAAQSADSSVPVVLPAPVLGALPHEPAVAAVITEPAEGLVPGHSDDDTACMADRSASTSSVGASSNASARGALPSSFRTAAAEPADAALPGVAHELDPRDPAPAHVDLGYLTDGVAAYIASLRDRLRQTQADLLTVPAQELRYALAELDRMRRMWLEAWTAPSESDDDQSPPKEASAILRDAWEGFKRGFVLAYAGRAGLGVMTRALSLVRQRQYSDALGWRLLSEKTLVYREDAVRLGLFIGGFTALYSASKDCLHRWRPSASASAQCFTAGTIAGITLMFQKPERRRTLALYTLARLAQCRYNSLKAAGRWHFWGSTWPHGDALLFALSSAQVMYAYVMGPQTLPHSYWQFIVKSGPVSAVVLEAVRRNNRGLPVDVDAVNKFCVANGGRPVLTSAFPPRIPITAFNPRTSSIGLQSLLAFSGTFRKTFPLYMSLSLVPYVVLNLRRAAKAPLATTGHAVLSALRSTSFLAAFVGLYQGTVGVHRKLFAGDSKFLYYVAGLCASVSLLIEKKSRRAELALYTMPRAADSLLLALTQRRWVPSLRFGEVGLFCVCIGGLMYYREHEPKTMAPFLNALLGRIVFGETSQPRGPPKLRLPRPPTIYFSPDDIPGGMEARFNGGNGGGEHPAPRD